jgi:HEAT repeat protein
MRERELVTQLGRLDGRIDAIRDLVGGVTATELRHARPSQHAVDAILDGLRDPSPQVRWWCVQLLDHLRDARAIEGLVPMLDDPVPRVRRNAAHALGCVACKPDWSGELPTEVFAKLAEMAATDENDKVRAEARRTLACRPPSAN